MLPCGFLLEAFRQLQLLEKFLIFRIIPQSLPVNNDGVLKEQFFFKLAPEAEDIRDRETVLFHKGAARFLGSRLFIGKTLLSQVRHRENVETSRRTHDGDTGDCAPYTLIPSIMKSP
jgi:hypothetical protein